MEKKKYTLTSENQNFNDLFLETLAWINFRQQKLIPNNKELSLFAKICCFRENCCIGKLLWWSILWICKKNLEVRKKVKFEWTITDGALTHRKLTRKNASWETWISSVGLACEVKFIWPALCLLIWLEHLINFVQHDIIMWQIMLKETWNKQTNKSQFL